MIREITAILVSWNDADDALEAAASLASARARIPSGGVRASLVAVDNAGGELSPADLERAFPGARLLVNGDNRGFGPAAAAAA